MSINDLITTIAPRQRELHVDDPVQIGIHTGTITNWHEQPGWVDYQWNIQVWVPALNQHIWKPLHELTLIEGAVQ